MRNKIFVSVAATAFSTLGLAQVSDAADLIGISFPESVQLSGSTTASGPRSVSAPFDFSGIGNIVNPSVAPPGTGANASDFTLHQTVGVVDLTDVVVTYEYDMPVTVDAFDVVQHHNGVMSFELLVGNSLANLTSAGVVSLPENTVEYELVRFDFDAATEGRFVQLRVIEPELPGQGGWAFYRAYPVLVPAPAGAGLIGLAGIVACGRRRR